MNTEWGYQFDPMQCEEILDGAQRGVNAELYVNFALKVLDKWRDGINEISE